MCTKFCAAACIQEAFARMQDWNPQGKYKYVQFEQSWYS